MSHNCTSIIFHCIDFRFISELKNFLESEGLLGDCDEVSVAGAIKDLLGDDREYLLKQIDISSRLHGTSRVILVAHEDCGAYGGKKAFADEEEEISKHKTDLEEAKRIIIKRFPDLSVKFVFARIKEEGGKNKIWFEKW